MDLTKVPAKAGCIGCFYENRDDCPAELEETEDGKMQWNSCTDENGNHCILIQASSS